MPQRDGLSHKQIVHAGNLVLSGTTPAASSLIDTRGFDKLTIVLVNNTVTDAGAAAGYSFEVQESDATAASGFTAVADLELLALESTLTVTLDTADNAIAGATGYVGDARYVRVVATGTTGTNADVTVIAILEKAHTQPPTLIGSAVAAT